MGGEESRESAPGKEKNKCNNPKAVNSGWAGESGRGHIMDGLVAQFIDS